MSHGLLLAATLATLLDGDTTHAARYALPNGGLAEVSIASPARLVSMDTPVACEIG